LDPAAVVAEVRKNSIAVPGMLPETFVRRVRELTDRLPPNEYQQVHEGDDDLRELVEDSGLWSVLRCYFKCEPVLLEASLFVSRPEGNDADYGQNSFHFDYAGWESLNLFVYLTDVGDSSSYHVVARGSHRKRSIREIMGGRYSDSRGAELFGSTLLAVKGPAGTFFFENTEAFHQRRRGNERRVMLNLLFSSHRSYLSHGRASRGNLAMRDREFKRSRSQMHNSAG
jgi:hypothetical protein